MRVSEINYCRWLSIPTQIIIYRSNLCATCHAHICHNHLYLMWKLHSITYLWTGSLGANLKRWATTHKWHTVGKAITGHNANNNTTCRVDDTETNVRHLFKTSIEHYLSRDFISQDSVAGWSYGIVVLRQIHCHCWRTAVECVSCPL